MSSYTDVRYKLRKKFWPTLLHIVAFLSVADGAAVFVSHCSKALKRYLYYIGSCRPNYNTV